MPSRRLAAYPEQSDANACRRDVMRAWPPRSFQSYIAPTETMISMQRPNRIYETVVKEEKRMAAGNLPRQHDSILDMTDSIHVFNIPRHRIHEVFSLVYETVQKQSKDALVAKIQPDGYAQKTGSAPVSCPFWMWP